MNHLPNPIGTQVFDGHDLKGDRSLAIALATTGKRALFAQARYQSLAISALSSR